MTSQMRMRMYSSRDAVCRNNAVQFQSCDATSYCTALGESGCTGIVSHHLQDSSMDRKLATLTQMVACLPLVQQVQGLIPGRVVNFHLKIFNLGAGRGGEVSHTPQHNYTTQTATHIVRDPEIL